MAGLRTNALVATLFVLLSAYGFATTGASGVIRADPTRVAAQIVSGIGFLGAGVILRDGLTVRGLNTAATLWCSAAVGALAGAGMYQIAALGTATVITANVTLHPLGRRLDRHPSGGTEITVDYRFQAVCADSAEAHIRELLVQAITSTDFALRAIRSYDTDRPPRHRHRRPHRRPPRRPPTRSRRQPPEPRTRRHRRQLDRTHRIHRNPRRHRGQRQQRHPTAQRAEPSVLATALPLTPSPPTPLNPTPLGMACSR